VLLGPSGCGESTTLRLIAGLEQVTKGEILIGGKPIDRVSPHERNIAMVFQNDALYPHLSAFENIAFGLRMRYGGGWLTGYWKRLLRPARAAEWAVHRKSVPDQVRGAARLLGIERLLDRMPRQLSGGERQRVALGRALVRQPAVFLFDEPLSNLDAKLRWEIRSELKQLHRRLRVTMVYVTHDQAEALSLGDRIAVLDQGKLQQIGTPEQIYHSPVNQFVAGFVGLPPMNFCPGRLDICQNQVEFVAEPLRVRLTDGLVGGLVKDLGNRLPHGKRVVLGVRPADVSVHRPGAAPAPAAAGVITLVESSGDNSFVRVAIRGANRVSPEGSTTNRSCEGSTKSSELSFDEGSAVNEVSILSRVTGGNAFRVHDLVDLVFDDTRIHLFAMDGGRRLASFP
jgi:multiple sugar transport system ATP-binding protein